MLTSIRSLMAAAAVAGGVMFAMPAAAQDEETASDLEITANAAIVSDYRFRGVTLSGGDPAIQGGVDVAHSTGFYVGTWGSSIDEDTFAYGHTEIDIYGGWTGGLTEGVTLDVGAIAYLYPNANDALRPQGYNYYEGYASLGFTLGPAETTVGVAYAPEQDSMNGSDNLYVFTDLGVGIPGTPVSLAGHLGYTDGFLTFTSDGNAWDWSLGADFAISENVSVGAAYVGAEGDIAPGTFNWVEDTVVFTLSASL